MSITMESVRLTYPDGDRRVVALNDVSLHVNPGEFVAVTGPSGSGKSSLLAVAGALVTPESGRVTIAGTDIDTTDAKARDQLRLDSIGFVFQQTNLLPSLTAIDQLLLVANLRGTDRVEAQQRAEELLERVGLTKQARRRPARLSGGERQRVGVARALMGNPALLLVDEPTSALDHERGAAIVELLHEITREQSLSTIMVTHDLQHLHLVDRTLTMNDGKLTDPNLADTPNPILATA